MTVVKWTDDLDTGFHDIDRQHQQLVEHINAFYEACGNNNRERMSVVLFDLISSASSHFEYEEGLMEQAGYPLLAPHRRVHQNFITKLMSLHEKLHEGENVADEVLHAAGYTAEQIDWIVPHQANERIIAATAKHLGISMEKVILTVAEHANTSAASIPLALDAGIRDGRIRRGQTLLFEGIGGGFAWGAVLAEY